MFFPENQLVMKTDENSTLFIRFYKFQFNWYTIIILFVTYWGSKYITENFLFLSNK